MIRAIRVLITGVGGGAIGEQVFKALRSGKNRYEILATNTTPEPMAVVQAEHYEVMPHAHDEKYISRLGKLIERYEIEFLIPGSEPELVKVSENTKDLKKAGATILMNSKEVIALCIDKNKTFKFLSENHIRVPRTFEVTDITNIKKLDIEFPCIVKPSKGSGGSAATFIAQQMEELEFFVKYLDRYQYRPLVQEYIGNAANEYTIGVLNSPDGARVGIFILNRNILSGLSNRSRVPNYTNHKAFGEVLAVSSGISQGRHIKSPNIKKQAETIAEIFKSIGPMNIQGRMDGNDFVPFEINPRFSGTSSLRAMAGFNEPEIMINWYLGEKDFCDEKLKYGEFTRGLVEYFKPKSICIG